MPKGYHFHMDQNSAFIYFSIRNKITGAIFCLEKEPSLEGHLLG